MIWRAELTSAGDTATVRLHGDLDLLIEEPLRQTLLDACDSHRNVVLDLCDVRLIDSTGLGLLVRAHQSAKRNGGVVCLVAPSRFIQTVLQTMRLQPIFPTFPDPGAAVAWLGNSAANGSAPGDTQRATQRATQWDAPRSPATGEAGDRGALGRA